jgi:hypothetical protein
MMDKLKVLFLRTGNYLRANLFAGLLQGLPCKPIDSENRYKAAVKSNL